MSFKNFYSKKAGSKNQASEPRRVGQVIIDDILFSNEHPLGIGNRQYKLFEDIFPHTEPCCELKLLMRQSGRPAVGALLDGIITRDSNERYVFIQNHTEKKKVASVRRNPVIFEGGCFNVHRLADGSPRLEVCHPRFYPDFTFRDFCLAGAQELLTIARLIDSE